ncbi:MAG: DNA replication/repair protein RecF [Muribaculaceae bacterium]|nr:DNA replication/repair protein RecF [Muribaculaceae bacterium]
MLLKQLSLTNFKNIADAGLEFSEKVNCFLGNNGMGKSNLLDAIYFLSFCKSFSRVNDRMLIRRGEDFSIVRGDYIRKGVDEELMLGLSSSKRKTLKRGGKEYDRLSSHIGSFPLVMVAPQDIDLIRESGEERRHWMDVVISQSDAVYLDNLIRYTRALEQRNRLLREGCVDPNLYGAVEIMLDMSGSYIHDVRAAWIEKLSVIFDRYYTAIAGVSGEHVSLAYQSQLNRENTGMQTLLDEARRHDEIVKHTSVGIHRDDIDMQLDGMPMRRTGSQGQCKTFTIALRMAQYEFLHSSTGMRPLLLLDDIFDKLDATRVERIMELVTDDSFGQIFITDTNRTHLDEIMSRTGGDYRLWNVENGCFTPIHQ